MSRLFTFGCSFTQYAWPTWADIIAYDREIEYYNYAMAGLGNVGIFHRIIEADLKHKFKDDDEIYILWSSWSREDRVFNDNWGASGSVLNKHNEIYDRYFVRKYWDFNNDIVKNSTAIIATNQLYKNLIRWQASSFNFFTTEETFVKTNSITDGIADIYRDSLPKLKVIKCDNERAFKKVEDSHPDILGHLEISKKVYNDLSYSLKQSTIDECISLQNDGERIIKDFSSLRLDQFIPKFEKLLSLNYNKIREKMNYHPLHENWHRS